MRDLKFGFGAMRAVRRFAPALVASTRRPALALPALQRCQVLTCADWHVLRPAAVRFDFRALRKSHSTPNPYTVLGVDEGASAADIKKRYFLLAKQYHPDVNKDPGAKEHFQEISDAYALLSDEAARAAFDSGRTTSHSDWQHQQQHYHQTEEAARAQFRKVWDDFGLNEFADYLEVVKGEARQVVTAAGVGDLQPAKDFARRHRTFMVSVVAPIALMLRFPGLIVFAVRGVASFLVGAMTFLARNPVLRKEVVELLYRLWIRSKGRPF
mmetsp:Transcript_10885/g.23230  ORF Transcript_10885/g.23230 Transcript_10885/m.23230 type:complete len:269 (-) Transcript_10885:152-958(-)